MNKTKSPLKHTKDGHMILNKEAHIEQHGGDAVAAGYDKEDESYLEKAIESTVEFLPKGAIGLEGLNSIPMEDNERVGKAPLVVAKVKLPVKSDQSTITKYEESGIYSEDELEKIDKYLNPKVLVMAPHGKDNNRVELVNENSENDVAAIEKLLNIDGGDATIIGENVERSVGVYSGTVKVQRVSVKGREDQWVRISENHFDGPEGREASLISDDEAKMLLAGTDLGSDESLFRTEEEILYSNLRTETSKKIEEDKTSIGGTDNQTSAHYEKITEIKSSIEKAQGDLDAYQLLTLPEEKDKFLEDNGYSLDKLTIGDYINGGVALNGDGFSEEMAQQMRLEFGDVLDNKVSLLEIQSSSAFFNGLGSPDKDISDSFNAGGVEFFKKSSEYEHYQQEDDLDGLYTDTDVPRMGDYIELDQEYIDKIESGFELLKKEGGSRQQKLMGIDAYDPESIEDINMSNDIKLQLIDDLKEWEWDKLSQGRATLQEKEYWVLRARSKVFTRKRRDIGHEAVVIKDEDKKSQTEMIYHANEVEEFEDYATKALKGFALEDKVESLEALEVSVNEKQVELEKALKDIEELGEVTQYSSEEDINEYNELVSEYKNIATEGSSIFEEYEKTRAEYNEIVNSEKFKSIVQKQKDLKIQGDSLNATGEAIASERGKIYEKIEDVNMEAGFNASENKFHDSYESTGLYQDWKDTNKDNSWYNTPAIFAEGMFDLAAKATIGFVLEAGYGLNTLTDGALLGDTSGKSQGNYSRIDYDIDMMDVFFDENMLARVSDREGSMYDAGFTFDNATRSIAEMLPFTLGIIDAARRGRVKGSFVKNPFGKVTKTSARYQKNMMSYNISKRTYKMTIHDNLQEGREMGLEGSALYSYGNYMSIATALSQLVMPDQKFLGGEVGKVFKAGFFSNLKAATTKAALKTVLKTQTKNLFKELGEEELEMYLSDMVKFTHGLGHTTEFFDIKNHYNVGMGVLFLSGSLGAVGAIKDSKMIKDIVHGELKTRADGVIEGFLVEENFVRNELEKLKKLKNPPLDKIKAMEETLTSIEDGIIYAQSYKHVVDNAPSDASSEQLDLLFEKNELLRSLKTADGDAKTDLKNKLSELDEKIKSTKAYDSYMGAIEKDIERTKANLKEYYGRDVEVYEATTMEEAYEIMKTSLNESLIIYKKKLKDAVAEFGINSTEAQDLRGEVTNINKEIKKTSDLGAELSAKEEVKKIDEQLKEVDPKSKEAKELLQKRNSLVEEESYAIQGFFANGFALPPGVDGVSKLVINKRSSAKNGYTTTGQHEFLHLVLREAIKNDPTLEKAVGDAVVEFMNDNDNIKGGAEYNARLQSYTEKQAYGEVLTLLSEALSRKDVTTNNGFLTNLNDGIRQWLQRSGRKDVSFGGGQEIFNFIKDYNKTFKSKKTNKAFIKLAQDGVVGKVVKQAKESTVGPVFSKAIKNTFANHPDMKNDFDKHTMDNGEKRWSSKADFQESPEYWEGYMEIENSKGLESLIKQGVSGETGISTSQEMEDFVLRTKENLLKRYKANYDPSMANGSLFGWLVGGSGNFTESTLYRAKGDVMVSYKKQIQAASLDEDTKRNIQIEAEADASLDAFENQDLTKEKVKKNKGIKLYKRLGEKAVEINDFIKSIASGLKVSDLNFKKLKDLAPELTQELFGIIPKTGNLTKQDIKNAQMFINKHASTLLSMLPKGSTASGTSTGVQNVLLDAFYDKSGRTKTAKTGSKAGLAVQVKKDNISVEEFLEVFGITERGKDNTYKKDSNTSARIKALVAQTGRMMTNQAVREHLTERQADLNTVQQIADGKSDIMFSKASPMFSESAVKGYEKMRSNLKTITDENFQELYEHEIGDLAEALFGKNMRVPNHKGVILDRGLSPLLKIGSTVTKKMGYDALYELSEKLDRLDNELADNIAGDLNMALEEMDGGSAKEATSYLKAFNKKCKEALVKRPLQGTRNLDAIFDEKTGETYKQAGVRVINTFLESHPQYRTLLRNTMSGGKKGGFFKFVNSSDVNFKKYKKRTGDDINFDDNINQVDSSVEQVGGKKPYNNDGKFSEGFYNQRNSEKFRKENDGKLNELKEFFEAIEAHLQNFPSDIWMFEEMLLDTSKHMNTVTRVLAPTLFYPVDSDRNPIFNQKAVEEHTDPQNLIGKALLAGAMFGKLDQVWKVVGKSYMQGSLLKVDDPSGVLKANMPQVYYDKIVPRLLSGDLKLPNGYSSIARLVVSGIDPNAYMLINEDITIAEFFGVAGMPIETANDLIIKQLTGEVDARYVTQFSKAARVMPGKSDIKKAVVFSKAVSNTRLINDNTPLKGMSAWDFDDTLATTKSGVRAKIPNPDGTPQPNRKVIFLAGSAGSGKGNVISKLGLEEQGFKIVNSDISLEWLKKNSGLPENMNDLTKEQRSTLGSLQYQARGIAKRKMMKYQGNADGVVVDGTGGSTNSMTQLVNEFKDKGYDVSMVFVETSLETALERNAARKERSLLDKIVEKNHAAVQGNKDSFVEMFGENFMEVETDNLSQQDAMPASLTSKMNNFVSGYKKVRLDAEQFATQGAEILEQGGEFDFGEFNVVTEGAKGPMFNEALQRSKKFGTKDTYVLTARPAASAGPIQQFLASQGLNIPLENITGLGNSTGEAKAEWMLEKFSEGYNNMFFADDAMQNVEAVKNVLDQLDIKSEVVQAKIQFSKSINHTTEKLFTNPAIANVKEAAGINNVKNVDKLSSDGVYGNIQFSKKHRGEYENLISKNRPDLVKEGLVTQSVDQMFDLVDGLDIPASKKRKYEQIMSKWLATSVMKMPEDNYKLQDAVKLAEKNNLDLFAYNNPNEIIEAFAGKAKAKPTNPDTVELFVKDESKTNDQYGITEYVVTEDKQNNEFWIDDGQQAVRNVVDTHWGPKSNPWCVIARDKDGTGTMQDAMENWDTYSDGPKRIVFQNGRLIAMYANGQYWDRMDNDTDAPVIIKKEGGVTEKVELVPTSEGKVDEFVMERRTVSSDKNTVTTEYIAETKEYEAGTTVVENRVNGVTVKKTTSRPSFDRQGNDVMQVLEVVNYNKRGEATNNKNFEDGELIAINTYGRPFGEMMPEQIVKEKGDQIEFMGTNRFGRGDYFVEAFIEGKVTEIGFQLARGVKLESVIKTSPNGEIRLDLNKVLVEDPNTKGLSGIQFSKGSRSAEFNELLERTTGIEAKKVFSDAQAKIRGAKGKYKGLVPASAQDFMGLMYNFLGKGKQGDKDMAFFKKALVDPFARGIDELNGAKQSASNDYKNLTKAFPQVKKDLNKKISSFDNDFQDSNFTVDQAARVYLWNKAGFDIPGLSARDLASLVDFVKTDTDLQAFADGVGMISKKADGYSKPSSYWLVENIASDLMSDGSIGDARAEFLGEWQQNVDQIFSPENLNKIEAIYGSKFVEALKDSLYRMQTGKNRPQGSGRLMNTYMNWVNNSVGAIMFLNMRSAVLQTISATNYVNWSDNNPLKAAQAFANQKQYWSDFAMIFNSDYLKQRRSGNQRGVNEADLSAAVAGSDNKAKAALAWLLSKGFLPTQIADSFAISSGGASFYRNRVKSLMKQGMSRADAESKAFIDFQETTEVSQQSARPDMISQQQANPLGRLILSFQNTPMQYGRIMNKAFRDITSGRGDTKTHVSKIIYYGGLQAIVFGALQSALFASLGDEDEEEFDKKKERIANQMVDSWLSVFGFGGKAVATIKSTIQEFLEQKDKGFNADHAYTILALLGFSPPIGSKARKIYSAIQTDKFNEDVYSKRGFTLDNPIWNAIGNVIEGVTNIPLGRLSNKMLNLDNVMDDTNEWWQRAALLLGWNTWDLGIKDKDIQEVKETIKEEKKVETKKKQVIKKEEKKKEKEKEEKEVIESNIEKQKKEKKEGKKDIKCAAVSKGGSRCKTTIEPGQSYCTVHEKAEKNESGKEVQCKKVKKDKKRCKMQTNSKSGYCYYHD